MINTNLRVDGWTVSFTPDEGHFSAFPEIPSTTTANPTDVPRMVGDCRLDNAASLRGRLGLSPATSVVDIIVAAYRAWGLDFPAQLLGDFGFALHDPARRRLILARDALGVRPLYYAWDGRRCLAGDDQERLLAVGRLDRSLNLSVVGEWCLHQRVYHPTETFFQSLHKVPHASYLIVDPNGARCQRYWSLEQVEPLPEGPEADRVEQLRDLLQQVVADRLDTPGPIGAHASGGLDSTPLAVLAGEVAVQRGQPFHGFNWCRPESGDDPEHYEWAAARAVMAQKNLQHHEIGLTAGELQQQLLHHDPTVDGTTTFEYERAASGLYQSLGIRTLFSGFGGDEYLTTRTRDQYRQAVRSGRWWHVWRQLRLEEPFDMPLWRLGLLFGRRLSKGWMPTDWRSTRHTRVSATRRATSLALIRPSLHPWLDTESPVDRYFQCDSIREQQRLMFGTLGYHRERLETWAILGRRAGLRYVYPLLDRRIVEWAHALPLTDFRRHGRNRYLYRQALAGGLPPETLQAGKRPEQRRVEQLIRARAAALTSEAVLDHIAASTSDFIDTDRLLEQCRALSEQTQNQPVTTLKLETKALHHAVLTLNLGNATG